MLVVCRGGGSLEDLWSFNDERVVRAIAASPLPVVCGVGHESDVTLADFAADLRAPTPTAAAELAAPPAREALAALAGLAHRLTRALWQRLDGQAQHLDGVALRLLRPADALRGHRHALALLQQRRRSALLQAGTHHRRIQHDLARRLGQAGAALLRLQQAQLAGLAARLQGLDPLRVVARGYALLATADGTLVTTPAQLHEHQDLRVTLAGGRVRLQVARLQRE